MGSCFQGQGDDWGRGQALRECPAGDLHTSLFRLRLRRQNDKNGRASVEHEHAFGAPSYATCVDPVIDLHALPMPGGVTRSSSRARIHSVIRASRVTNKAPVSNIRSSINVIPEVMNVPNPPAPTKAARVALPMTSIAAVRTPVTITGSARGTFTRQNRCDPVKPRPVAASRVAGSTPRSPMSVLMTRGGP